MFKQILPALVVVIAMTSCSSMKPMSSAYSSKAGTSNAIVNNTPPQNNSSVRFLDDIAVEPASSVVNKASVKNASGKQFASGSNYVNRSASVEKASGLQLKYAILLNTEVELLQDNTLLEHVDEWYGTRYRYGGTSKSGIDCSAFVQAIYLSAFAVSLPRTARDQYRSSRIISATEVKTGDLVFFNTTGGISHVGIYLQNNKFVHASTSQGVTVSDMFDAYYLKRFIGIGRVEKPAAQISR